MPRPRKGARLYLRPARRDASGAIIEAARWIIRDGPQSFGTGCSAHEGEEAERRLAEYITSKHQPERRVRPFSSIKIADVISIYFDDVVPGKARPQQAAGRAERLIEFFGDLTLDEITGKLCREYEGWRRGKRSGMNKTGRVGTGGGARRDLQDLAAAINHHHREGLHREVVRVVLPKRGTARQRWMRRDEAARLLWTCWRTKETQRGRETIKHPLRHLCRFLLLGIYTGSRPGAVLNASWLPGPGLSYVDVGVGVFHRHADGRAETDKRQPVVRLAPRLLAHLRRWRRMDAAKSPPQVYVVTSTARPSIASGRP